MTARRFVDTNVLIYAGSRDPADRRKRDRAQSILGEPGIGFSTQVMGEYFEVAYRKGRLGISHAEAVRALRAMARRPVAPMTPELVLVAADVSERYQISTWDAAIVAAASALECEVIWTEDLNHGQTYLGVRVENPFLGLDG